MAKVTSSTLEDIRDLLLSFNPREIKSFKSFIGMNPTKGKNLHLKLTQLLLSPKTKKYTEKEIAEKLYLNASSIQNLRMLTVRLLKKTKEFLSLDSTVENSQLEIVNKQALRCRQNIIICQFLNSTKANSKLIPKLTSETIRIAKQYEFHGILVDILTVKKYHTADKVDQNTREKVLQEISHYAQLQMVDESALDEYNQFVYYNHFSSIQKKKQLKYLLKKSITKFKGLRKKYKTARLEYFSTAQLMQYYFVKKDYTKAQMYSKLLSKIVRNPAVYKRVRYAAYLITSCECSIFLRDYARAKEYSNEIKKYLFGNQMSANVPIELEYYAQFYSKEFPEALKTSLVLIKKAELDVVALRNAKYYFFQANALFMLGRYRETLRTLSESIHLKEDKTGWDFGYRFLQIMTFIETEAYDQAESATEALRKRVEHFAKQKEFEIRSRDKKIYHILHSLAVNSYNFKRTQLKETKNLTLLENTKGQYQWEAMTHEIIQFNEWFAKKVKEER